MNRFETYTPTDLLRELSRLVITNVSGRRSYDLRHRVLLHKFGHIESYKRFGRIEKIGGKGLDKLGLSDTRRSRKNE